MAEAQQHESLAAIHMGQRCRSLAFGGGAAAVQCVSECSATGKEAASIRAHFVVGADGVQSFVRNAIDESAPRTPLQQSLAAQLVSALEPRIEHGRTRTRALQHLVSVHFRCAQLFELLEGPGGVGADAMLYFVYNEVCCGTCLPCLSYRALLSISLTHFTHFSPSSCLLLVEGSDRMLLAWWLLTTRRQGSL